MVLRSIKDDMRRCQVFPILNDGCNWEKSCTFAVKFLNIKIMNVVSSKEFVNIREKRYKEPDEDFYRAITMDAFIEKALIMVDKVDKMYAKKECNNII